MKKRNVKKVDDNVDELDSKIGDFFLKILLVILLIPVVLLVLLFIYLVFGEAIFWNFAIIWLYLKLFGPYLITFFVFIILIVFVLKNLSKK